MNIKVVTIDKIKTGYALDALEEYSKRLSRYCKIKLISLKNVGQLMKEIDGKHFVILVNTRGEFITSEGLSDMLSDLANIGRSDVMFLLYEDEISEDFNMRIDCNIAISKMEIDLSIRSIILYEQIYRAYKIMNNETYHK